ncbi:MAG: glutamate synthase subunit beta [Cyclobacteriaceae bacterium]|nr:glutamate synthase subunit beta [Cyclobacteriaceae bacterium]
MGKPTGFLEFDRELPGKRDPKSRINDYKELYIEFSDEKTVTQAARCMDCGVPFCHTGCPLGNIIPEFNDAVYQEDWGLALEILHSTNNFPEFTGRICPAPCESSCVLGINKPPVAIELIEKSIIEKAYSQGLVKPIIPPFRTGKQVAVVGSGPSGLAAAAQLNQAGHSVVVFEREDRIGGLLRYGIPDFKLEKTVIDRRLDLMKAEGITFETNVNIGVDVPFNRLVDEFDAVVLCGGSTKPRDLNIDGRNLNGIHFAMDFLRQQNKRVAEDDVPEAGAIMATGKHVIVIGGGDTGSDCVGTSNRHKAKSVTQIELLSKPSASRTEKDPWPNYPMILRTSTSHEEGADRHWSILTKEFVADGKGNVKGLKIVDIVWEIGYTGKPEMKEVAGTERELPCDLALLAIGFLHGETDKFRQKVNLELDSRGNIDTKDYQTNIENVFAAGDMRRGQSLVVWAIAEGREAARAVDKYLMKESYLLARDKSLTSTV